MKKRIALLVTLCMLSVGLTACGVSQEDYDAVTAEKEAVESTLSSTETKLKNTQSGLESVQSELDAVQAELESTKAELDTAKTDLETTEKSLSDANSDKASTEKELKKVKKELKEYKEKMKPFEEMTEAQAEAEKAKAEQEKREIEEAEAARKAEEEAAAAAKAAEEEAARQAEEAKGYETGITYDQLARTPDDYMAKKVKFHGKVVQVLEGDGTVTIRFAVDSDYDRILYCEYDSDIVTSRVLEDDQITIYGISAGLYSYKSTMGGTITIPAVLVDRIDQ